MKLVFAISLSLLMKGVNAQTNNVIVKLDTLYSGIDTYYLKGISNLTQLGYSKNKEGVWSNSAGDRVPVAAATLAMPSKGFSQFFDRIKLKFQHLDELNGSGSVIFRVDKRGQISDVYFSPKGNASIQSRLLDILDAEPWWKPGISSGSLVEAMYKLTVSVKQ